MTQELALLPNQSEWQIITEMARVMLRSGYLPDAVKTEQQVIMVMLKARELNVPPMQALSNIHIVKGKPTLAADLMVGLLLRDGHKVWTVESTDKKCTVKGHRRNDPDKAIEVTFTIEDAQKATLAGKDVWKSYPAQMLYARAASRVCRMVAPDVLAGMYTPEELGAEVTVNESGQQEVINAPATITVLPVQPQSKEPDPALVARVKNYCLALSSAENNQDLEAIWASVEPRFKKTKQVVAAYNERLDFLLSQPAAAIEGDVWDETVSN
jgi:hypothetical protein